MYPKQTMNEPILESVLTCQKCGFARSEITDLQNPKARYRNLGRPHGDSNPGYRRERAMS